MREVLNKFLNAYWLRPEIALWRTCDVESMKNFEFKSPSLDLGCGDGVFSFLRAGGVFGDAYDVFMDVDNLNGFFANEDVYDSFHDIEKVEIKKQADYKIDIGLDHKSNLLEKARKKDLYNELVVADANKGLPFEDESLESIFSNIIYWLNDPLKIFTEIHRVLRRGGTCCVMLPNSNFLDASFYYTHYIKNGQPERYEFLKLIDRGRTSDNIKIIKTYDEWKYIIEKTGLEVVECIPHLSKSLIQIWDIGLRPIFPMLKKMTMHLDEKICMEIKKEWVDLFLKIGEPIVENEGILTETEAFCFYCFILRKK